MASGRRKDRSHYFDDYPSSDDEYSGEKGSVPRVYRPGMQREDSLVKRKEEEPEKVDSGWDTDYDPRDKYYLSADDDDDWSSLYSPDRKASRKDRHTREYTPSSRHRSPSHSHSRRRHSHHHRSRSDSHSRSRDSKDDYVSTRHHKSSTASSSRPKSNRTMSHTTAHRRPKPSRAPSSYTSRPRPVRGLSRRTSSTTSKQTRFPHDLVKLLDPDTLRDLFTDFPWDEAGKVALQAGTVAAVKVGSDAIPWHVKGTKIASAALGAAVVDHVLKPKKRGGVKYAAMRHLTEIAMSNMVVGPAMGKASAKSHSGGGGRSSGGGGGRTSGGGGRTSGGRR